jgi:hypothetical protein
MLQRIMSECAGTEPSDSYQFSRNTSNERNWYAQGNCSSLPTENKTIGTRNEEYYFATFVTNKSLSIHQTNNKNTNTTASTNLQFQCNPYWLSLKAFSGHPHNDYYS